MANKAEIYVLGKGLKGITNIELVYALNAARRKGMDREARSLESIYYCDIMSERNDQVDIELSRHKQKLFDRAFAAI